MSAIFDQEKFIFHFKALSQVDENKFSSYADPLIIYKDGPHNRFVQVSILPFASNYVEEMATKTFAEKMQYYKRDVRSLNGSSFFDSLPFDTVRIIKSLGTDLGTYDDFYNSFVIPDSSSPTIEEYFDKFLDLSPDVFAEFQNAFNIAFS